MVELCNGKIIISDRQRYLGVKDNCHNHGTIFCEDCGKSYCKRHIDRGYHICEEVPGGHSIWKGSDHEEQKLIDKLRSMK